MKRILRTITLCWVLFLQSPAVWSQTEIGNYNFFYYGSGDGLPQEDILSLFQDHKGYIWFGTYSGAARYDGKNYQVYNTASGLAGNSAFDIAQDKDGIIYIATNNGISVLTADSLYTVFKGQAFNSVFVDNANRKWFYGDRNYELFMTDDEKYAETAEVLERNFGHIYSVVQHPDSSSVYLATNNGLFCLNSNNKCIRINASSEISYLYADKDSYLWLATKSQLYRIPFSEVRPGMAFSNKYLYPFLKHGVKKITQAVDGNIWGITSGYVFLIKSFAEHPEIYDRSNGLAGYTVYSLMCDYENNTWIGLVGGAQKLRDKTVRRIAPLELNGYVATINEDKKGRIWFTMDHQVYYIHNDRVVNFSKQLFPDNSEIQTIYSTKLSNGNILIVYPSGLKVIDFNTLSTVYTHRFEEPVEYVECVYVSSKDEIFISDSYNSILYYMSSYRSPLEKFESDETSGVYMFGEYKGQILATNETGICVFNGDSFGQLLELDHSAWCLFVLNDDLWVGTEEGLGLYCADSLKFIVEGTVNTIAIGRDAAHLWLGMSDGIYHVNIRDGSTEIAITAKRGLPHGEISIGALMTDSNDLLWAGSFHGIAVFDYDQIPKYFTPPRNDLIIRQNDVVVPSIDSRAIKAFYHSIHFEMIALSFVYETDNIFEYVLESDRSDNLPVTKKESVAQYNNLPPGNYTFRFRSKGAMDIWSDDTSVSFYIPRPVRMQWWFYAVCLLSLCVLLYFVMRLYANILKEKNVQLEQIINERTEYIKEQNEKLATQNEELSETYQTLQQINEELESYKNNLEELVLEKTAELIKAKEKAEESDRLKSSFLANMSHEIRTPMNGIVGFLNHIENKDLPQEKVKEYYKIIHNNVQRLLKLINDILDISKLEVDQLNVSKAPCNLNELMHELFVFYDETILNNTTKKLAIVLDDVNSIPDFNTLTDSIRLRQILTNLIDNAIKFTKIGLIEFGYQLTEQHIQFHVMDTGIGMDEEHLKVIFDRFRQADDTIAPKYGGTGLGLAISRELAILLGGDMWVESELNNGSTFYFTILYEKVQI